MGGSTSDRGSGEGQGQVRGQGAQAVSEQVCA